MDAVDRFFAKVVAGPGGCWIWAGHVNHKGYGIFYNGGRRIRAHQFSLGLVGVTVPAGMVPDHLCRVRRCVNWGHLEVVTPGENSRRSPIMGRPVSDCKTCGGPKPAYGVCRPCRNNYQRAYRAEKE